MNGAWARRIGPLLVPFGAYGAWLLVLRARLGAWPFAGRSERMSAVPLGGLIDAASGFADPRRSWLWLTVGAVLVVAVIARRGPDLLRAVVVAFATFGAFMGTAVWHCWQDFGRALLPLYAYGFLVVVTWAAASFEHARPVRLPNAIPATRCMRSVSVTVVTRPLRVSSRARQSWLLALFLLAAFGPLVAPVTSQPGSRLALTAAVAEHHTIGIRGYPLGIDRATYNGELRSDKAPGQPLLAVPAYLLARAAGAESASHLRQPENLTSWWVTFWTAFLPYVGLVVLMYLVASRYTKPIPALAAAVGLGVCSMLLPHAVNLYGATLAAFAAFAAWAVVERGSPTNWQLVAAGALAGLSVAAEYETVIVAAVLAVVVVRRVRGRVGWFALGAAGPVLVLCWYQTAAFGRPWRTAHEYYATAAIRREIVGYARPGWRGINATLFGSHGLLLTNVIVLVGLAAAILLARSPSGDARRHARVALTIAVPYIVLCIVWKGTPALEEPGPRYMIPLLPFLAVPLAIEWRRVRRIALVAMGVSGAVAVGAATAGILTAKQQQVLPELVDRVKHGRFLPTIWSMAFGRLGVVLYGATVVVAAVALIRAFRAETPNPAGEVPAT